MKFIYHFAAIVRKVLHYKIYCRIVGDSYSEEIAKIKKDIWHNQELYTKYQAEIDYIKKQGRLCVFPYPFHENYKGLKVKVYREPDGMKYVLHAGKKLFFPREWTAQKIKSYYSGLLAEQDTKSPHRYFTDTFKLIGGGVFVDAGCAEAMTSLTYVDIVSELYLFECDDKWIEALKRTFHEYEYKVHIIQKFVSDKSEGNFVRLDDVINEMLLDGRECLIKIDIEGSELCALKGAEKLLCYDKVKIACCLYHNKEDEELLCTLLEQEGFHVEISEGYMLQYFHEGLEYPYFRKVLARAVK